MRRAHHKQRSDRQCYELTVSFSFLRIALVRSAVISEDHHKYVKYETVFAAIWCIPRLYHTRIKNWQYMFYFIPITLDKKMLCPKERLRKLTIAYFSQKQRPSNNQLSVKITRQTLLWGMPVCLCPIAVHCRVLSSRLWEKECWAFFCVPDSILK